MTKEDFIDIKEMNNWCSHRYLLWPALEAVKHFKLPILELGAGYGSSPFMRQYCKDEGLEFLSYDIDKDWAEKQEVIHVKTWEDVDWRREYGMAFVDESPGEHRRVSISRLHHVKIVCIHDSERPGWNASDYQVRPEIEKYTYFYDMIPTEGQGAWTSLCSNFIDVSKWVL